jgi:mannose-6-phosphate isomerase class I
MNFFSELKRRNVYKVPIALAKVIDLAKWLSVQI